MKTWMKGMIGFIGMLFLWAPLTVFAQNKVVVIPLFGDDPKPKPTLPAPLPKTGQTQSYGDRDDGDLQKGVAWPDPRFTANGNGTVTDNLTGLIWLQDGNCTDFFDGDTIVVNDRPWNDALIAANNLSTGKCGLTDGSVAGDWRLPNLRELQSLIDYGEFNPALSDGHPFTNTILNNYWSSTTDAGSTDYAWRVAFYLGYVNYSYKSASYYVLAVRSGQ